MLFWISDLELRIFAMWKVVGHKRALSLLQGGLSQGRIAHAYLFTGPTHVGKMTLARDLACALNCESGEPPCGECSSCQRILSGKHSDVQEISLGKNVDGKFQTEISIEEIRQLQHSANLPPFEGKCRVFIIDGAECLSTEAANCLLKALEEPMDRVVFVLLTTKEQLLLATVVSRCQRIDLHPLSIGEVQSALTAIWKVPAERANLLARLSHGCLGWAVTAIEGGLLDERVAQIEELITTIDAGLEDRFDYAARLATEFGQDRERVQAKLSLWLDWWRDLMLLSSGLENMVTNVDRLDTLGRMAAGLDLVQIRAAIESIILTGEQLNLNANARLALEVLMLSLPTIGKQVGSDRMTRYQTSGKASQST